MCNRILGYLCGAAGLKEVRECLFKPFHVLQQHAQVAVDVQVARQRRGAVGQAGQRPLQQFQRLRLTGQRDQDQGTVARAADLACDVAGDHPQAAYLFQGRQSCHAVSAPVFKLSSEAQGVGLHVGLRPLNSSLHGQVDHTAGFDHVAGDQFDLRADPPGTRHARWHGWQRLGLVQVGQRYVCLSEPERRVCRQDPRLNPQGQSLWTVIQTLEHLGTGTECLCRISSQQHVRFTQQDSEIPGICALGLVLLTHHHSMLGPSAFQQTDTPPTVVLTGVTVNGASERGSVAQGGQGSTQIDAARAELASIGRVTGD